MIIGELLCIEKRKGKISDSDRAKIRHDYGYLIDCSLKHKKMTKAFLCGKYCISISSLNKILK